MPKQQFDALDFFGPVVVGAIFGIVVFLLSFLINFIFIQKTDEVTAFEKVGAKFNMRVGPHRLSLIKKAQERHFDENGVEF